MPKIFIYVEKTQNGYMGYAVAEDGTLLASHFSTTEGFARFDMGMNSLRQHEKYERYYPGGFELEWVNDPTHHDGLQRAAERARDRKKAGETANV